MDTNDLSRLCDARDTICKYCGKTDCEECIVTKLISNAFNDLEEDGDGCHREDTDEEDDEKDVR